jgi:hypothetical protein
MTLEPLPVCPFCGLPITREEDSLPENAHAWMRGGEDASDIEAHVGCVLRESDE